MPNVSNPSSSEDYTLKGESTAASFSSSLGNQWSRFNLWGRVNYANTWDDHKLNVTLAASREQTILNGQHNTRNRINMLGHVHYVYADKYVADLPFRVMALIYWLLLSVSEIFRLSRLPGSFLMKTS